VIRNAVIHMFNEQPLLADLFEMPKALDQGLLCTNLRTLDGKRPVFVDKIENVFYFPYLHIRFLEFAATSSGLPELEAGPGLEWRAGGPLSLSARAEYLRGVYFGIEGRDPNPYGPSYDDFRVVLVLGRRWLVAIGTTRRSNGSLTRRGLKRRRRRKSRWSGILKKISLRNRERSDFTWNIKRKRRGSR